VHAHCERRRSTAKLRRVAHLDDTRLATDRDDRTCKMVSSKGEPGSAERVSECGGHGVEPRRHGHAEVDAEIGPTSVRLAVEPPVLIGS
jgi:hypothetical protein